MIIRDKQSFLRSLWNFYEDLKSCMGDEKFAGELNEEEGARIFEFMDEIIGAISAVESNTLESKVVKAKALARLVDDECLDAEESDDMPEFDRTKSRLIRQLTA